MKMRIVPAIPRPRQLRLEQFGRVLLDDQRIAPSLAFAPPEMPIRQHLGIAVGAAIELAETGTAGRPGQAMGVGAARPR